MDYEFKNLQSLIRNAIDTAKSSKGQVKTQFAKTKSALSDQAIRARRAFALRVVSSGPDMAKTTVRYHQQSLINFSDQLYDERSALEDAQILDMVTFFIEQIEELISSVQHQTEGFFNLDCQPSEFSRRNSILEIKVSCEELKAISLTDQGAKDLLNLALQSIEQLFSGSIPRFLTYRQIHHSKTLLSGIGELIRRDQCDAPHLYELLITINHNSEIFIGNYTKYIRSKVHELESISDKIEMIAKYLKEVNQLQSNEELTLNPHSMRAKDWIVNWLFEEMQYLETTRVLMGKGSSTDEQTVRKEFKMELDMSVAQFACFIKSFVETGVIQNKNVSELIRFLAKVVRTKRSENISYESFRMKYYNVEGNTKEAVRNFFHTAIGRINST